MVKKHLSRLDRRNRTATFIPRVFFKNKNPDRYTGTIEPRFVTEFWSNAFEPPARLTISQAWPIRQPVLPAYKQSATNDSANRAYADTCFDRPVNNDEKKVIWHTVRATCISRLNDDTMNINKTPLQLVSLEIGF